MKVANQRVYTGDRVADAAQKVGQDSARAINASIFAGGVLLTAEPGKPEGSGLIFVAAQDRAIAHGLGRPARGFFEVYGANLVSASSVRLRPVAYPAGTSSATHISVRPLSNGTAWVFVF